MPSDSASSIHQADDSADDSAAAVEPEAARAAEPEAARAAEPEAAPAADPDAWKQIGLHGQWKNRWFINVSHRVKDTSLLNDCHRQSDLHTLRANFTGDLAKKLTHLCVHSHFDEEKQLIFCLASIVSTFSKAPGGTPKEHRNAKDAYNCTNIVKHNAKVHNQNSKQARQADFSMVAGVMEESGGVLTSPSFASAPLQKFLKSITNVQERRRARQKVKQMRFYVYGKCSISAWTLNDPYFREVLKAVQRSQLCNHGSS